MTNKTTPNLYPLQAALKAALLAESPAEASALLSAKNLPDLGSFAGDVGAIHSVLQTGWNDKRTESAQISSEDLFEARRLMASLLVEVNVTLPRFRIVILNESEHWTDPAFVARAGEIWAAYLYDENRKVHIADTSPSYEMTYLYCSTTNQLSDADHTNLLENGSGGEDGMTMYCRDVDNMGWNKKLFCDEPSDPGAEDYDALLESEREYYCANICFDLPCSPRPEMLIEAARQCLLGGDLANAKRALGAIPGTDAAVALLASGRTLEALHAAEKLLVASAPSDDLVVGPAPQ